MFHGKTHPGKQWMLDEWKVSKKQEGDFSTNFVNSIDVFLQLT